MDLSKTSVPDVTPTKVLDAEAEGFDPVHAHEINWNQEICRACGAPLPVERED